MKRASASGLVLGVVVAALGGCADDDGAAGGTAGGTADGGAHGLEVVLAPQAGALHEYLVVATRADGQLVEASCPGSGTADYACTSTGVRFPAPAEATSVTVKARGFEFVVRDAVSPSALPVENGAQVMRVPLALLGELERNDDYATGFDAQGLESFRAMAMHESSDLGPVELVKFVIADVQTEPRVYFQHTRTHQLHYEFAHDVLGLPLSRAEFESSTYRGLDRKQMAGTLAYYPAVAAPSRALGTTALAPVAVTFFPSDDLTPGQAALAHRLVEARLGFAPLTGADERVTYVPAGSVQEAELATAERLFAERAAAYLTHQELYGNVSLQILGEGLAYGTLRVLTPEQLEKEVVSFTDVLLLPRLPNWLPIVGGTLTEELQTPLSHVNIAARTRGTPNIALPGAQQKPEVAALVGKLVRFEVSSGTYSLREATLAEAEAFWNGQHHDPFVPTHDDSSTELTTFDDLHFADALRVGVKAANLAELHHVIPGQAPDGFAVPFHYYDGFMASAESTPELCEEARDECVSEGRTATLCDEAKQFCAQGSKPERLWDYAARLVGDSTLATNSALREAALAGLRFHIEALPADPAFAEELDARVIERFGAAKVRLRSSTNSEDLEDFSGAGLYTSEGAYGSGEKAASVEIRKVWASVWNWKAYEERAFWAIDHLAVRMGVGVHQAFTEEAANGVLITQNVADLSVAGMYANVQLGEESVTNPTNGALPEIFSILPGPAGVNVARQRYSSLSPSVALLRDDEILALYRAADEVVQHFAPLYQQSPASLALDLEFKFNEPDRALVIKQARPYTTLTP